MNENKFPDCERIGPALVSELDLDRVADVVMKQSIRILGVDAVALWLADQSHRELNLLAHCNFDDETAIIRRMSYDATSATARAAETGQIQVVEDVLAEEPPSTVTYQLAVQTGTRSLLAVPLFTWGQLVGVVTYCCRSQRMFSPHDLEMNATVAGLFAMAIANARLHQYLRNRERQVSLLLKATSDALEEQRQRICLEIHDGITQMRTSASHHFDAPDSVGAAASGGILIKAPLLQRALSNRMQVRELSEAGRGKPPNEQRLSEREQEVLKLLAEGWTNKEIANTLVITEVTVKKHVQSIIAKLGASDRTHAAILAIRSGLIR